jgi:hypothetical protein
LDALSRFPACVQAASGVRTTAKPSTFGQPGARAAVGIPLFGGALEQRFIANHGSYQDYSEAVELFSASIGSQVIWAPVIEEAALRLDPKSDRLQALDSAVVELWGRRQHRPFVQALLQVAEVGATNPPRLGAKGLSGLAKTLPVPQIRHIPDVRRAADRPLTDVDLWKLAQAAARKTDRTRSQEWAHTLELILMDVFGGDVAYEVQPRESSGQFLLRLDGETDIDLNHVGAGVREAVAIAYTALSGGEADVLCIEEPENCLHPTAVRRLLSSLLRRTGVQLVVTTHAAAVLNSNPDTVVRIARAAEGGKSTVVDRASQRFEAIRSLGYSLADLVLAPCAVWVEGPSDRLYVKHWLSSEGLHEGIDYQIMFFGGALGTHITTHADPDPSEQLAAIRRLGRRCVVIVDSDKDGPRARLKRHVERFKAELDADPHALLEITRGREIENYLPIEVVNSLRRSYGLPGIDVAPALYRVGRVIDADVARRASKVEFARRAVEISGDVPPLAKAFVRRMSTFIRASQERIEGAE